MEYTIINSSSSFFWTCVFVGVGLLEKEKAFA